MMRTLTRITLSLLSLFAIIALLLTLTPLGLPSTLKIANILLPGELKVKSLGGSILRKIEAEQITYKDGDLYIRLDDVTLDWKPGRLINKTLYIQDLNAKRVILRTPKNDSPKERKELTLESFTSDYTFILNQANVYDLTWENHNTHIDRFSGTLVVNQRGLRVRDMYILKDCNHFNFIANVGPGFSPNIRIDATQRLSFDQTQMVNGKTYIEGDLLHLELEQMLTRGITAELKAEFKDLTGDLHATASGTAKIEDVNKVNTNLSGQLSLDLDLEYKHATGEGNINLTTTGSEINNLPLFADFHGTIKDYIVHWKDNSFSLGENKLTTSGYYGRNQADFDWQIAANNLAQISRRLNGTLQTTGTFNQEQGDIDLRGNLAASNFRFIDYSVEELLSPNMRWGNKASSPISLQLSAQKLRFRNHLVDTFALRANGTQSKHQLDLQMQAYDGALQATVIGESQNTEYKTQLTRFDLNLLGDNEYRLAKAANMMFSETRIVFAEPVCIANADSKLCLNYGKEDQDNQLSLQAQAFPTNIISRTFNPTFYLTGDFDLAATALWETGELPTQADLNLTIKPGIARLGRNRQRDWFEFGASQMTFNLTEDTLKTQADFAIIGKDFVHWNAKIIDWQDLDEAKLEAQLQANITELEPLKFFILQTDNFGADLKANLHAKGPILSPTFSGDLRLEKGHFDLSGYGITLTDATLVVEPDGFNKQLLIKGSAQSDDSPLTVTGDAKWVEEHPDINLHITGEDFKVSDTSEALVYASPDIKVHFDGRVLDIAGELHIPTATLNIQSFRNSISASPDVVILQEVQDERPSFFILNTDVLLSLGRNIDFKAGGLVTKLTGGIKIVKLGDNTPRASGQIASKDGSYAAYGQRLEIETGVLSFNSSPLDNPALNIEATRKVTLVQRTSDQYIFSQPDQSQSSRDTLQQGKVGVRVTGTVQNPQYGLFSVPQLSEEDQLSYLLTGSPAGQLGAAQAAFMLAAIGDASGMLGFSDTDSASLANITSNMGVDVSMAEGTRIDPETGEAVSDTNVVVGAALHPKLYVSYSVGLLDPINMFQVRYQLSRRFALQSVTTSEGDTGGDIIYGIETDGFLWLGD